MTEHKGRAPEGLPLQNDHEWNEMLEFLRAVNLSLKRYSRGKCLIELVLEKCANRIPGDKFPKPDGHIQSITRYGFCFQKQDLSRIVGKVEYTKNDIDDAFRQANRLIKEYSCRNPSFGSPYIPSFRTDKGNIGDSSPSVLVWLVKIPRPADDQTEKFNHYLLHLQSKYAKIRVVDPNRRVLLRDIFIPPQDVFVYESSQEGLPKHTFEAETQAPSPEDALKSMLRENRVPLKQLLNMNKDIIFLGESGIGKSILVYYLAGAIPGHPSPLEGIPIIVDLSRFFHKRYQGNIEEWIKQNHKDHETLLLQAFSANRSILLLDAADEAWRHSTRLEDFINLDCKGKRILLFSRPSAVVPAWYNRDFLVCRLIGFGASEIETFIQNWFDDPEVASAFTRWCAGSPEMKQLAHVPLLLAYMATLYPKRGSKPIPTQLGSLFERIAYFLMINYNMVIKNQRGRCKIGPMGKQDFLNKLGFEMFVEKDIWIDEYDLRKRIEIWVHTLPLSGWSCSISPELVYDELTVHNGFLVENDEDQLRFFHPMFQDYFTACHLSQNHKWEKELSIERIFNTRWWNVIRLLVGILPDSTKLIEHIWGLEHNEESQEDIFFTRLFFAAECVAHCQHVDLILQKAIEREVLRLYPRNRDFYGTIRNRAAKAFGCLCMYDPQSLKDLLKAAEGGILPGGYIAPRHIPWLLAKMGTRQSLERLFHAAQVGNVMDRKRIIYILGTSRSDEAVPFLERLLSTYKQNIPLSQSTLHALGSIKSRLSTRAIIPYLTPGRLLAPALWSLSQIGMQASESVPHLCRIAYQTLDMPFHLLIRSLARIGTEDAVLGLIKLLEDDRFPREILYREVFWNLKPAAISDRLQKLLSQPTPERTKNRAARCVKSKNEETDVDKVLQIYRDRPVTEDVIESLERLGTDRACEVLMHWFNKQKKSRVRIILAFEKIASERAVFWLKEIFQLDLGMSLRRRAMRALHNIVKVLVKGQSDGAEEPAGPRWTSRMREIQEALRECIPAMDDKANMLVAIEILKLLRFYGKNFLLIELYKRGDIEVKESALTAGKMESGVPLYNISEFWQGHDNYVSDISKVIRELPDEDFNRALDRHFAIFAPGKGGESVSLERLVSLAIIAETGSDMVVDRLRDLLNGNKEEMWKEIIYAIWRIGSRHSIKRLYDCLSNAPQKHLEQVHYCIHDLCERHRVTILKSGEIVSIDN